MPSIFYTFKYEIHEKISLTSNLLGFHKGFPFLTAFRLSLEPPTAALKINEALSTKILVTSSADFVWIAFDKSVI